MMDNYTVDTTCWNAGFVRCSNAQHSLECLNGGSCCWNMRLNDTNCLCLPGYGGAQCQSKGSVDKPGGNFLENPPFSISLSKSCYALVAMCAFGLVCNVLNVIILGRYEVMKDTTRFLLKCLSIADIVFLFVSMIIYCFLTAAGSEVDRNSVNSVYFLGSYFVLGFFQIPSVWMIVIITIERYTAICWPLRANRYLTMKRVRIAVGLLAAGLFTYVLITIVSCVNLNIAGSVHLLFVLLMMLGIVNFLLPMPIILVANSCLIKSVRNSYAIRKEQRRLRGDINGEVTPTSAISNELKCAVQVITVSCVFFICQLPQILISVSLFPGFSLEFLLLCGIANSFLMTLNSGANFFIYCLTGAKFRNAVVQFVCCVPMN